MASPVFISYSLHLQVSLECFSIFLNIPQKHYFKWLVIIPLNDCIVIYLSKLFCWAFVNLTTNDTSM